MREIKICNKSECRWNANGCECKRTIDNTTNKCVQGELSRKNDNGQWEYAHNGDFVMI